MGEGAQYVSPYEGWRSPPPCSPSSPLAVATATAARIRPWPAADTSKVAATTGGGTDTSAPGTVRIWRLRRPPAGAAWTAPSPGSRRRSSSPRESASPSRSPRSRTPARTSTSCSAASGSARRSVTSMDQGRPAARLEPPQGRPRYDARGNSLRVEHRARVVFPSRTASSPPACRRRCSSPSWTAPTSRASPSWTTPRPTRPTPASSSTCCPPGGQRSGEADGRLRGQPTPAARRTPCSSTCRTSQCSSFSSRPSRRSTRTSVTGASSTARTSPPRTSGQSIPGAVVSYLQSNPDTNYVVVSFDDMGLGVAEAIDAAGLGDKVKIVAQSGSVSGVDNIVNDRVQVMTIPQGPGQVGLQGGSTSSPASSTATRWMPTAPTCCRSGSRRRTPSPTRRRRGPALPATRTSSAGPLASRLTSGPPGASESPDD